MQAKRTPVLSALRRNELPKNKIGLGGNGLDGKKIKCVERLRQLSILKVLVNQDRDVCMCVNVISGCLELKLTIAGSPKAISQSHSCAFPASLHTDKKEAADAQM